MPSTVARLAAKFKLGELRKVSRAEAVACSLASAPTGALGSGSAATASESAWDRQQRKSGHMPLLARTAPAHTDLLAVDASHTPQLHPGPRAHRSQRTAHPPHLGLAGQDIQVGDGVQRAAVAGQCGDQAAQRNGEGVDCRLQHGVNLGGGCIDAGLEACGVWHRLDPGPQALQARNHVCNAADGRVPCEDEVALRVRPQ